MQAGVSKAKGSGRRETGRSRTGCVECRRKRRKCDEQKPQCGQCRRAGWACNIIDTAFRQHPYTFAAQGGENEASNTALQSSSRPQPPQNPASPQSQPENLGLPAVPERTVPASSSPGASNLYNDDDNVVHPEVSQLGGTVSSRLAGTAQHIDHDNSPTLAFTASRPDDLTSGVPEGLGPSQMSGGTQIQPVISPAAASWITVSDSTFLSERRENGLAAAPLDDEEVAFLLRHFAEAIAPCMDILSSDQYFKCRALFISRESNLVRYAACAAAAKQLGHMSRPDRFTEGVLSRQVFTRITNDGRTDYLWYGAKYYGKAIQAMASELSQDIPLDFGMSPDELPWNGSAASPMSSRVGQSSKEARLIAAEIMCYYEELSASWRAWGRHLNGIFKILQLHTGDDNVLANGTPALPWGLLPRKALVRSFWRFVHNDLEQSFISERPSRLATGHSAIWQSLGQISGASMDPTLVVLHHDGDDEDISNGSGSRSLRSVMGLMCKIVEMTVSSDSLTDTAQGSGGEGTPNKPDWRTINAELETWAATFTVALTPDIVQNRHDAYPTSKSDTSTSGMWFANDVCALASMYFRACKILILMHYPDALNKGPQRGDWLRNYRQLCATMAEHARVIIAIALGKPSAAARSQMLQPLYIAGRCCWQETDQRRVVTLLRDIESDLGLATNYRVKALLQEWGTPTSLGNADLDAELSDLSS